ncbi:hypothetical protein L211DRAFT_832132 [Terfezia boudieri ATCC MYA-4762]|uniref:Uncharacterized protein n=1 Tax=Terfezia boudieri ATCC MYA-4762 TaxID=1051890 RepID=A0A3N4M331_9PEZI|nr:hypothetical protein L211DRAFT_832132 [Terfezia boudieri ATCC MYA-4762]
MLVIALLAEPTRVYYINQLSDNWVKEPGKTGSRFFTRLLDIYLIFRVTNLEDLRYLSHMFLLYYSLYNGFS